MADIKITDLAAYTAPTSTDVIPAVDVGNNITKKVTISDLMKNAATGSATNPGISFDGDIDTGLFQPGGDQIGIATNGTEAMRVNSNGSTAFNSSVLIGGTTTPDATLHVKQSGTPEIRLQQTNLSSRYYYQTHVDGVTRFYSRKGSNNGSFIFYGDDGSTQTEYARLNNSGNAQFSGSVSIGGTAAANTIDEYEEGTWTPAFEGDGVNTFSGTMQGDYVRCGDIAVGTFNARYDASSNITDNTKIVMINGFPYNTSGFAQEIPFLVDNRANTNTSFAAYSTGTIGYRGVLYDGKIRLFNLTTGAPITWADVKTPNTAPTTGFKATFTVSNLVG